MADVFISYAREDRSRAEQVARALQGAGIEAFWDTEIPPGQTWADYIEGKLSLCKALIVLWSEHSTKSQWVREEARMGRDKGKLIPAMLDTSPAPFGFGEVQAANLSQWNGDPNDAEWKRVQSAVQAALGRPTSPPPPPAPPRNQAPPPPTAQTFTSFNSNPTGAPAGAISAGSPIDYVRYCFQHYVDGKGRARRSEFWWFFLAQFVALFVAAVLDVGFSGLNSYTSQPNDSYMITWLVLLAFAAPYISVSARRFHDIGMNGWLVLLGLVPYLGTLFIAVVGFIPGQPGENKYGPNPKGV